MTGLRRRVQRLTARASSTTCPVCGNGAGGPVAFVFDETPGDPYAPRETEYCPGCGRVTWFTITFDRADAE